MAVGIGMLTSAIGAWGASPAEAYSFTGCKSRNLANNVPDNYATGVGMTPWYGTVLDDAAPSWWRKGVRGGFKRGADYEILVSRAHYAHEYWMQTRWTCSGGWKIYRTMTVNASTIEDRDHLAAWQVRFIFVHEFGHLVGLNHTSYGCGVSIMRSDSNAGNSSCSSQSPPWSDDMAGYHALYG